VHERQVPHHLPPAGAPVSCPLFVPLAPGPPRGGLLPRGPHPAGDDAQGWRRGVGGGERIRLALHGTPLGWRRYGERVQVMLEAAS